MVSVDLRRRRELPDRQLHRKPLGADVAGYEINKNWSAALNVNNLFDKTYYQMIGAPGWGSVYGKPHNTTLTVRGTF